MYHWQLRNASTQAGTLANPEHLAKLREGVEPWNQWKKQNPEVEANLREARLGFAELEGADLRGAILIGADLTNANLDGASLSPAYLQNADLSWARLIEADLRGADLPRGEADQS
jgi:uncharacterized protein YjbI with pentapeptide repeats